MANKPSQNDDLFDLGTPATTSKRYVPKSMQPGGRNPQGPANGPSGPMGGPSGPMFTPKKSK